MTKFNGVMAVVAVCTAAATAQSPGGVGPGTPAPGDLADVLSRVGDRVEEYFRRAQSIVCLETVRVQPIGHDLMPDGRARVLQYELRVTWEPAPDGNTPPDATVLRELLTVDGRPPRPSKEPECLDSAPAISPEPLAMLLRGQRDEFLFASAGARQIKGRRTIQVDYKTRTLTPSKVSWHGDCSTFSFPGTKGRVWVDASTSDVVRLDQSLMGFVSLQVPRDRVKPWMPASLEVQRVDSSIHYRRIGFHDPDEDVLLPDSIESVQVVQGTGVAGVRTTRAFSNYKRFVTGGRVVK